MSAHSSKPRLLRTSLQRAHHGGGRLAIDVSLAAAGWLWLAIVLLGAPVALRGLATFGFAAFGPGLALRGWIPASDRLERFVFSIAASLSVCVIVTLALGLAHTLTTGLAITCIAALTTLAAGADAAGAGPRRAGAGAGA